MGRTDGALLVDGFMWSPMDRGRVRWSWFILLFAFACAFLALGATANDGDGSFYVYDTADDNVTYGPFWTADWNGTENITCELVLGQRAPYYGNEPFTIGVLWPRFNLTEHPNRTVDARVGLDEAVKPQNLIRVFRYQDMYGNNDIQDLWLAISHVHPDPANTGVVADVETGEGPLHMVHNISVQPARVVLEAEVATPNGTWTGEELAWGALPIRLVNSGGEGATDLVVDIRYDDRIIRKVEVNLVPPLGNHTFEVAILLIHSTESVQIYLVQGAGAPGILGDLSITVEPRPILDVVELDVSPTVVENGERVHIEAVVRNRGNATTTGQMVELMVDGSIVANESVEGLEPLNETTITTRWVMKGEGLHTISAVAEGDDFAARPRSVEVKRPSPSLSTWTVLLAMLLVSLAARRSRPARRA